MHSEALRWAGVQLGARVTHVTELTGGLTSTMLCLTDDTGTRSVLRLMTKPPWRAHGPALVTRERDALLTLAGSPVPAPRTIAIDPDGSATGVAAHLMSHLPGRPEPIGASHLPAMARMLATIHDVEPIRPFRTYQSWAPRSKWVVPGWTTDAGVWEAAFELLAGETPSFRPAFIHRDHSHRNLLWDRGGISGVVDWVETSTGPAGLDVAHVATNLAVGEAPDLADAFLDEHAALTGEHVHRHWLVMDAVGFLAPPDQAPLFGSPAELSRLDAWLRSLMRDPRRDRP